MISYLFITNICRSIRKLYMYVIKFETTAYFSWNHMFGICFIAHYQKDRDYRLSSISTQRYFNRFSQTFHEQNDDVSDVGMNTNPKVSSSFNKNVKDAEILVVNVAFFLFHILYIKLFVLSLTFKECHEILKWYICGTE